MRTTVAVALLLLVFSECALVESSATTSSNTLRHSQRDRRRALSLVEQVQNGMSNLFANVRDTISQYWDCDPDPDDPSPTPSPDYCLAPIEPTPNIDVVQAACPNPSYKPGDLTVDCLGLRLSTGLACRIIAVSGAAVAYDTGGSSAVDFHARPDGAGCFATAGGGWIYTSNSEVPSSGGGVGAITFDATGNTINYQMILTNTIRNCGGGKLL